MRSASVLPIMYSRRTWQWHDERNEKERPAEWYSDETWRKFQVERKRSVSLPTANHTRSAHALNRCENLQRWIWTLNHIRRSVSSTSFHLLHEYTRMKYKKRIPGRKGTECCPSLLPGHRLSGMPCYSYEVMPTSLPAILIDSHIRSHAFNIMSVKKH